MRGPNCPRHKDAHYTGGAHGVNAGAEPVVSTEYLNIPISYRQFQRAPRLQVVNRRHWKPPAPVVGLA